MDRRLRSWAGALARGALGEVHRMKVRVFVRLGVAGREQLEDLFRKAAALARRFDEAQGAGTPSAAGGRSTAGPQASGGGPHPAPFAGAPGTGESPKGEFRGRVAPVRPA